MNKNNSMPEAGINDEVHHQLCACRECRNDRSTAVITAQPFEAQTKPAYNWKPVTAAPKFSDPTCFEN
jgi:hypothetical protein